jgi:hypothetical protein
MDSFFVRNASGWAAFGATKCIQELLGSMTVPRLAGCIANKKIVPNVIQKLEYP